MIFLDTGAWVALAVPGDPHAAEARRLYAEIARGAHGALVTTDFVLDEAVTLARMASDAPTAARLAETVLGSRSVTVVWIDRDQVVAAVDRLRRHADKRSSLTDCTSFEVMEQLRITDAFTFDHNFEEAGFTRRP